MGKHEASERIAVYAGSGNVYAVLGYPDADAMPVKAQLVSKIAMIIGQRPQEDQATARGPQESQVLY